jgi:hypothetical protein
MYIGMEMALSPAPKQGVERVALLMAKRLVFATPK